MFCYGYYLGEALLQSDLQDVALVEVKPRRHRKALGRRVRLRLCSWTLGPNIMLVPIMFSCGPAKFPISEIPGMVGRDADR